MGALGEDLLLVAIDPANGVLRCRGHLQFGLMGAELVMLADSGHIVIEGDRITVTRSSGSGDAELDSALAALAAARKPPRVRGWVGRPRRRIASVYLDRLIASGAIGAQQGKLRPRWPVLDQAKATAARSSVDAVALGTGQVDKTQTALAALAEAIGLARLLYPGADGRAARQRLRELAKAHWAADPVRRAVASSDASAG